MALRHEMFYRRAARRTRPGLRAIDSLLPLAACKISGAVLPDRLQKCIPKPAHTKRSMTFAQFLVRRVMIGRVKIARRCLEQAGRQPRRRTIGNIVCLIELELELPLALL